MSKDLVTLSNDVIIGLLRRPEVVTAFPFMLAAAQKVQPRRAGCGGCAKRKTDAMQLEGIKTALGNMSSENKEKLKSMLGAKQVRLYFSNARGQTVKSTF